MDMIDITKLSDKQIKELLIQLKDAGVLSENGTQKGIALEDVFEEFEFSNDNESVRLCYSTKKLIYELADFATGNFSDNRKAKNVPYNKMEEWQECCRLIITALSKWINREIENSRKLYQEGADWKKVFNTTHLIALEQKH